MNKNSSENLKNKRCSFLLFSLLIMSPNVFAYLDPGTGAMIVQAVIAMFIGAGIFFNHIKLKILEVYHILIHKIKGTDAQDERDEEKQKEE
jgi:hypothetical protein